MVSAAACRSAGGKASRKASVAVRSAALDSEIDESCAVTTLSVMPGLVPGIHDLLTSASKQDVDGRDKPGHDD
jgi:hypothetical protein